MADQHMPDEMTIVGTYFNMPEALMAQGKLKSEGIECSLDQEEAAALFAIPGVSVNLRVEKKDEEAAQMILAEAIPETIVDEETGEEYHQPECPKCHSLDVSMKTDPMLPIFPVLEDLETNIQHVDLWKCENCNHEWPMEKD